MARRRTPRAPRASTRRATLAKFTVGIAMFAVAFVVTAIPARRLGYLSSQRLLDVITKHNLGRFYPLAIIVLVWAALTTVLIELVDQAVTRTRRRRTRDSHARTSSHGSRPVSRTTTPEAGS